MMTDFDKIKQKSEAYDSQNNFTKHLLNQFRETFGNLDSFSIGKQDAAHFQLNFIGRHCEYKIALGSDGIRKVGKTEGTAIVNFDAEGNPTEGTMQEALSRILNAGF